VPPWARSKKPWCWRSAPVQSAGTGSESHIVVQVGSQLAEVERLLILATYESCGRHKERTAALLGISMKTLYNRLKEYQQ
jgi:DNA-binding NtrC family response regulator